MEPTKDRITPEQFYSESKWPEMKDKFDKSAFLFHYYDLCQFANDYSKHYRNVIKLTTEDKERISIDAEEYVSNLFGTDADGAWRRNAAKDYIAGATAEHERLEKDQDYIDLKETIGSAQQELQAYRDIIKELLPLAEKTFDSIARHEVIYAPNKLYKEEVAEIIGKARKLIE